MSEHTQFDNVLLAMRDNIDALEQERIDYVRRNARTFTMDNVRDMLVDFATQWWNEQHDKFEHRDEVYIETEEGGLYITGRVEVNLNQEISDRIQMPTKEAAGQYIKDVAEHEDRKNQDVIELGPTGSRSNEMHLPA